MLYALAVLSYENSALIFVPIKTMSTNVIMIFLLYCYPTANEISEFYRTFGLWEGTKIYSVCRQAIVAKQRMV